MARYILYVPCTILLLGFQQSIVGEKHNYIGIIDSFAGRFYKELSYGNENLVCSPLSAYNAISMVGIGAYGATKSEILNSLGIRNFHRMRRPLTKISKQLNNIGDDVLNIANKIYVTEESYSIRKEYSDDVHKIFNAEIEKVNFFNDVEAANIINNWVTEKTNYEITDIISSDAINSNTAIVVINAIYFKGLWAKKFNSSLTKIEEFYTSDGSIIPVQMMTIRDEFLYKESPELDAQIIILPYKNQDLNMIIILPNHLNGLRFIAERLDSGLLKYLNGMTSEEVNLKLPKFAIESELNLEGVFTRLGARRVFTPNAQLSNMLTGPTNLYISNIIQKAYIDVSEDGTEASAATGITVTNRFFEEPVDFIANHPFYFAIVKSGTVLFSGQKTS